MLHFEYPDGSIFFLNHLISFFIIVGYISIMAWLFSKNKKDKLLHSAVSAIIVFILLHVFVLLKWHWWMVPIVALLIGVIKEIADFLKKRLFDPRDILADLLGIAMPTGVYFFSFLM